jgi:hypothetical protein
MEHRRNSLPEMRPFLEQISDAKREAVWKEIEMVMRLFERGDGVVVPTERLVAVGPSSKRGWHYRERAAIGTPVRTATPMYCDG